MNLKQIIGECLLGMSIAVSPLLIGCEDYEGPSYDHKSAEGHAAAFGTWYKPEEGTTSSGWSWHWGYFYLEQDGTNVWGYEKWEQYGARNVEGHVDGNKIHLRRGTDERPTFFDGTIDGNVFNVTKSFTREGKTYRVPRRYTKTSDEIPERYY
jgi:hypothetical protein